MEKAKFVFVSETEKALFHRMLTTNFEIEPSKKVMSFWMFLESRSLNKFYHKIFICDEKHFKILYGEAEIALSFLDSNSSCVPQDFCPLTSQFFHTSLKEIILSKEKVNDEISFFYDVFCHDGFEDAIAKVNLKLGSKLNALAKEWKPSVMTSKLNPLAKAWDPSVKARKVDRTLFMIFPHVNYVDKNQVFDFFQRMCGEGAVHDVYTYKKEGVDTTYGKIVFKNTSICAAVLKSGERDDEAKYYIGYRHVFLKKYEPRL